MAKKLNLKIIIDGYFKEHKDFKVNPEKFINPQALESYLLGWLWADGHLAKDVQEIIISIKKQDADIIKKHFLATGQWRVNDYKRKKYPDCIETKISTTNRPLFQFLKSMGYQSKSESPDKILSIIPKEFHKYWLRGLFEGDGCVHITKKANSVSISGPYEQNWDFLTNLLFELGIRCRHDKRVSNRGHKSSYVVISSSKGCVKFLQFIYEGADNDGMILPRKYNKFIENKERLLAKKIRKTSTLLERHPIQNVYISSIKEEKLFH
jgi:intein/homing endonuclease